MNILHKVYRFLFVKQKKSDLTSLPISEEDLVAHDGTLEDIFEDKVTKVKPAVEPKPSIFNKAWRWIKNKIPWLQEQIVIAETGLTTRQRLKRYDLIMEGNLGAPQTSPKSEEK